MKHRSVLVVWLCIAGMVATAAVGCATVPERIPLGPGQELVEDVVVFQNPETGEEITTDGIHFTGEWLKNTEEGKRWMEKLERDSQDSTNM